MRPHLWKEVRLLLPAWCAAVLLVALPFAWSMPADWAILIHRSDWSALSMEAAMVSISGLILGLLLLGISSFGREFSHRTFQLFLSQPATREQLWRRKVAVLGVATFSVWLIFWVAFNAAYGFSIRVGAGALALSGALVSTGLWTTLLFRQVMPALCFSLLLPAILVPILWPMADKGFPPWIFVAALVLLAVYAVVVFRFALRLFQESQDLDPWLANLSLFFARTKKPDQTHAPADRRPASHPTRSLVRKEINLHQVNLICGAILFLMLGVIAVFLSGDDRSEILQGVQVTFFLAWLFMPALAGSIAIAEERKLGALQGQQCLPISRSRQFLMKLIATGGVALLLGLVVPVLVSWVVASIAGINLVQGGAGVVTWHMGLRLWDDNLNWVILLGADTIFVGTLAFYASSLSRSTLSALVLTLVALFAGAFLMVILHELWRGASLLMIIGLPIGVPLLVLLTFRNFREHLIDARVRWQNFGAVGIAAAVVLLLTGFTHYRAWEVYLPEPVIGSADADLANGAEIYPMGAGRWILHLADGRLWVSEEAWKREGSFVFPDSGRFLEDDGWVKVTKAGAALTGLRTDGSLWKLIGERGDADFHIETFGNGARWNDIAAGRYHTLGVQADGTLWGWGRNYSSQLGGESSKEPITEPRRIGSDADWIQVHATEDFSIGVKEDGTVWYWGNFSGRSVQQPERWSTFPESELVSLDGSHSSTLAVLADGTLWAWGWHAQLDGTSRSERPRRMGDRNDWKAVGVTWWDGVVALRQDGSLWGANLRRNRHDEIETLIPHERLSDQSKWVAIRADHREIHALASDGTWWFWDRPDLGKEGLPPLLAPSRRFSRVGE